MIYTRHIVGAALSLILVASLAAIAVPTTKHSGGTSKEVVPQPQHWVAFEANVTVSIPGAPTTHGRFYRASDGADRLDTGPDPRNVKVISINNLQQRMHYVMRPSGWSSYPLDLPQGGWHPHLFNYPKDMSGLSKLPDRIFVDRNSQLMAVTATVEPPKGTAAFEAYRYVIPQGVSFVLVPDLNFFPILTQDLTTGKRIAYWNIRIDVRRAQSLFDPPSGVPIARVSPPAFKHLGHDGAMLSSGTKAQ